MARRGIGLVILAMWVDWDGIMSFGYFTDVVLYRNMWESMGIIAYCEQWTVGIWKTRVCVEGGRMRSGRYEYEAGETKRTEDTCISQLENRTFLRWLYVIVGALQIEIIGSFTVAIFRSFSGHFQFHFNLIFQKWSSKWDQNEPKMIIFE